MNTKNIIYTLDSYKQLHSRMYPANTETVYSYLEARKGAMYTFTTFFGLQYILKEWLEGVVITRELIDDAEPMLIEHFKFNGDVWNRDKWDYIVDRHGGKLPIRIKAVAEGKRYPIGTVLVTVENTDPNCYWLTNAIETVLLQVWYPITVCTRSGIIVDLIKKFFKETVSEKNQWLAEYYLHDFAQRGCSCMEQAGIGGMAHLVNSKGTDTDMAMPFAMKYYDAKLENLAYSVPASEHSIATSLGEEMEFAVTKNLIKQFPKGILSVVSDSYDISNAVKMYCTELKKDILNRDGKFVVRPDSPRFAGDTPENQVMWIVEQLGEGFGYTTNNKGYNVLNPKVGVIYGDSLTETDIQNILQTLKDNGWSSESCVFGCGSYLLAKLNRDSLRFAFKCSAMCRNGKWHDVYKNPMDTSKVSKKGRFNNADLKLIFEDGKIVTSYDFNQIRENAK